MNFTPEQELYLLKQQMAQQQMAQQSSAQPSGAITGQGIRAWWVVIAFLLSSLVGFCVWLATSSSKATEQFVNITRDITELQRQMANMTKPPNDVTSLPPRVAAAEAKQGEYDRLLIGLPPRVQAVEEKQKEQDKVLGDINKTLAGIPQQFTNLSGEIRALRGVR